PPLAPPPLALIFFLHSADALLDLHSFPTRRSSDLGRRRGQLLRAGRRRDGQALAEREPCLPFAAPGPGPAPPGLFLRLLLSGRADRKSTRLNSSHVKISYAVFCLKKKIDRKQVSTG